MTDDTRRVLARQYETAWALASHHLAGLSREQWMWRPTPTGLHVSGSPDAGWRGDWPEREDYDIGPPSIAWLTWHMGFWWSMVLDHSFGDQRLTREDVATPGEVEATCDWLKGLQARWRSEVASLDDGALHACALTRWPFRDRPFADVVAWVTLELTKNAAEIGYARFLWARRGDGLTPGRSA